MPHDRPCSAACSSWRGPARDLLPAGPLLTGLEIGLPKIQFGIKITERLCDCLDPLPMHASNWIEGTCLVVLACLVCSDELCGHRDQLLGLIFDVFAVILVRLLNQLGAVCRVPL